MRASWGEATLPSINRLHLARCRQPRVQERGAQPFERTDFPRQRKEETPGRRLTARVPFANVLKRPLPVARPHVWPCYQVLASGMARAPGGQ